MLTAIFSTKMPRNLQIQPRLPWAGSLTLQETSHQSLHTSLFDASAMKPTNRSRSPNGLAGKRDKQTHELPAAPMTLTDGESDNFEFGGSLGAASLMVGFPLLMWYLWVGATFYGGQLPCRIPIRHGDNLATICSVLSTREHSPRPGRGLSTGRSSSSKRSSLLLHAGHLDLWSTSPT